MTLKPVKIRLGPEMYDASVEIDGVPVEQTVTSLAFSVNARGERRVTLELPWVEAEVSGEARIVLPERTREVLVALGWTPPAETDEEG